jgi:hypothetical protein
VKAFYTLLELDVILLPGVHPELGLWSKVEDSETIAELLQKRKNAVVKSSLLETGMFFRPTRHRPLDEVRASLRERELGRGQTSLIQRHEAAKDIQEDVSFSPQRDGQHDTVFPKHVLDSGFQAGLKGEGRSPQRIPAAL